MLFFFYIFAHLHLHFFGFISISLFLYMSILLSFPSISVKKTLISIFIPKDPFLHTCNEFKYVTLITVL